MARSSLLITATVMLAWAAIIAAAAAVEGRTGVGRRQLLGEVVAGNAVRQLKQANGGLHFISNPRREAQVQSVAGPAARHLLEVKKPNKAKDAKTTDSNRYFKNVEKFAKKPQEVKSTSP